MKSKQEIHDRIAADLQALLEFAKPSTAHEALDVIGLHIEAGGLYLAAAASRQQSAGALRIIADHVTTAKLPPVAFVTPVPMTDTKH